MCIRDSPYTMRVVSEITESNGSSSMASVCGGCLSLMDAGVPMKAHVAGIAMGLIKEDNRFAVLTDILGDEDHLGDMDFKVAGSTNGITAVSYTHLDVYKRQGAVLVNIEDTVVLATVVGSKIAKAGQDFFPLTVDYIEKTYAAGKIPGSFFKREAKPSELETLTSRLIDRPIRPLFPEGFFNDVHVVIHTVSLNPEVDADIAALIATSAALAISGIPFNGPIGAARVGYINGEYVLNPGQTARKNSQMDLVVAVSYTHLTDAAVWCGNPAGLHGPGGGVHPHVGHAGRGGGVWHHAGRARPCR